MSGSSSRTAARRVRGARARRAGRAAEVLAAFWIMLHGWRVMGFRLKAAGVEIDLAARRGGMLAVIEVKRRRTLAEAREAVTPAQRARLRRAGETLALRYGRSVALEVRLDLLALAPGRLPVWVRDAWNGAAEALPWP